MTTIKSSMSDRHYIIELKGHADSAEYGKDLVCCAESMLVFTLMSYLEKQADRGRILGYQSHAEDGYIRMECDLIDNSVGEGIEAIEEGFKLLVEKYEKYIKFI